MILPGWKGRASGARQTKKTRHCKLQIENCKLTIERPRRGDVLVFPLFNSQFAIFNLQFAIAFNQPRAIAIDTPVTAR
jgi:hypothetical protein